MKFNYANYVKHILEKEGFIINDIDSSYLSSHNKGELTESSKNDFIEYSYSNGIHKFIVSKSRERAKLFRTYSDYKVEKKVKQIMKYLKEGKK